MKDSCITTGTCCTQSGKNGYNYSERQMPFTLHIQCFKKSGSVTRIKRRRHDHLAKLVTFSCHRRYQNSIYDARHTNRQYQKHIFVTGGNLYRKIETPKSHFTCVKKCLLIFFFLSPWNARMFLCYIAEILYSLTQKFLQRLILVKDRQKA